MWTAIAFYYLCCVCLLPYHLSVECSWFTARSHARVSHDHHTTDCSLVTRCNEMLPSPQPTELCSAISLSA